MMDSFFVMPDHGSLYTYFWASNGVWIKGTRDGLQVVFPVAEFETRGLHVPGEHWFKFDFPKVPVDLVRQMWVHARAAAFGNFEQLYHLVFDEGGWQLIVPEQTQTDQSCRPLDDGLESSHARAVIEVHSHHEMRAFFSPQDNLDETGFRLYGVLGRVLSDPTLRLRVGLYGHFWEIAAAWVFEMPEGLKDAHGVSALLTAQHLERCSECDCTELEPCVENAETCYWVLENLCSFCAEALARDAETN